jgi:hypothetical protein
VTCKHRMGIEWTDTGPVCISDECRRSMCRNCLFCEAIDPDGRYCSESCRTEHLVAASEANQR